MQLHSFDLELPRAPNAPLQARELIAQQLGARLSEGELETATLLASELVSNAVRHGEGRITLHADLDENRLRVEVTDEGGGLERKLRERNFEDLTGWGLRIVDAAASRWDAHEGTTHVWFEIEHPGPRLGTDQPLDRNKRPEA